MDINEAVVRQIVEKVVSATVGANGGTPAWKHVDPSGIISIKTPQVPLEGFEGRNDVRLADVTTLEEAPRMGCGIMELTDGADFEWTLTYDEYDIVLEGTLQIQIDGRIVTAGPGEIIYIPKGSPIHFKTPSYAKYVYTVFPADWQ